MNIGILSDTHDYLPPSVFSIFKDVDAIIHAGDIGNLGIISELEILAPVYAILGNIDTWPVAARFTPTLVTELDGLVFYLTHHIVSEKYIRYQLFRKKLHPDVVVSGHTHVPNISTHHRILFINPGSVSKPREGDKGTVILLDTGQKPLKPQICYLP